MPPPNEFYRQVFMQALIHGFQWLYDTLIAAAIRENSLLFPSIETVHVMAVTLVFGSILVVDLRLLGITWRHRSLSRVTADMLPVTWIAFVVAAISGSLMFVSNALVYGKNVYFWAKVALLVVAFINMLVFHRVTARHVDALDELPTLPSSARMAGAISLVVWVAIIACGRWIGFTMAVS